MCTEINPGKIFMFVPNIKYIRKAKLLAGSNIYVTEDFSKRVKDKRIELQKFMKKLKKK